MVSGKNWDGGINRCCGFVDVRFIGMKYWVSVLWLHGDELSLQDNLSADTV